MTETNYQLGESTESISLERPSEYKEILPRLFEQAEHRVRIYSLDLDPLVFNNRQMELSLSQFVRRNRNSHMEILVHDTRSLASLGHRLVSLSQHLSSHIHIRKIHPDYTTHPFAFYTLDNVANLFRPIHSQWNAELTFYNPLTTERHDAFFTEVWERSEAASELRALSI